MFLRDMYCSVCGRVSEDVVMDDPRALVADIHCETCGSEQAHVAMCNGGLRSRWRENDLPSDPRFYRGMVETTAPEADSKDGPAVGFDGKPIQERARFNEDARNERRERAYWDTDKRGGHTPLVFDQGKL